MVGNNSVVIFQLSRQIDGSVFFIFNGVQQAPGIHLAPELAGPAAEKNNQNIFVKAGCFFFFGWLDFLHEWIPIKNEFAFFRFNDVR